MGNNYIINVYGTGMKRNMIASCKRRDDPLAEYITLTECNHYREECLNSSRLNEL